VLRRWNDKVQLVLRPQGVFAARSRVGLRAVERITRHALPETARWEYDEMLGAAALALTELDAMRSLRGAALDVVVCDEFAHLDVVRGDFFVQTDRQIELLAQAWVAEVLGSAVAPHSIRWQLQQGSEHLLVATLNAPLLQAINEMALEIGMRLRRIETLFAACWNAPSNRLRAAGECLFACAELGYAVIASVQNGVITGMSQGAMTPDEHGLDRRADRLLASLGREPVALERSVLTGYFGATGPRWTQLALPPELLA
jgi:hypothetical protein